MIQMHDAPLASVINGVRDAQGRYCFRLPLFLVRGILTSDRLTNRSAFLFCLFTVRSFVNETNTRYERGIDVWDIVERSRPRERDTNFLGSRKAIVVLGDTYVPRMTQEARTRRWEKTSRWFYTVLETIRSGIRPCGSGWMLKTKRTECCERRRRGLL